MVILFNFQSLLVLFFLQTDAITLEHVQKQLDHCITEHRYFDNCYEKMIIRSVSTIILADQIEFVLNEI